MKATNHKTGEHLMNADELEDHCRDRARKVVAPIVVISVILAFFISPLIRFIHSTLFFVVGFSIAGVMIGIFSIRFASLGESWLHATI